MDNDKKQNTSCEWCKTQSEPVTIIPRPIHPMVYNLPEWSGRMRMDSDSDSDVE